MFAFDSGTFVPIMIFALPIIAVAGGITAGIVKTISRHRLIELAQRERIAAIERGIDPARLPSMPAVVDDEGAPAFMTMRQASLNRARGMLVGGIVTTAAGIGIALMLHFLADSESDRNVWAVGMIPTLVGVALLLSSFIYQRFAAQDAEHERRQP